MSYECWKPTFNLNTTDGEKEWQQRDGEFEVKALSKQQLLGRRLEMLFNCLQSLTEADLAKTIYIRYEPLSVTDAINRQLAHYPYHVGQIVYIGRMIKVAGWINLSIPKNQSAEFNTIKKNER